MCESVGSRTRREHLQELLARSGLVQFTRRHYRGLSEFLPPVAMQTIQGIVLASAAVDELRRQRVLLPYGERPVSKLAWLRQSTPCASSKLGFLSTRW
jgi:Domain of unknown function (DUF4158)